MTEHDDSTATDEFDATPLVLCSGRLTLKQVASDRWMGITETGGFVFQVVHRPPEFTAIVFNQDMQSVASRIIHCGELSSPKECGQHIRRAVAAVKADVREQLTATQAKLRGLRQLADLMGSPADAIVPGA